MYLAYTSSKLCELIFIADQSKLEFVFSVHTGGVNFESNNAFRASEAARNGPSGGTLGVPLGEGGTRVQIKKKHLFFYKYSCSLTKMSELVFINLTLNIFCLFGADGPYHNSFHNFVMTLFPGRLDSARHHHFVAEILDIVATNIPSPYFLHQRFIFAK